MIYWTFFSFAIGFFFNFNFLANVFNKNPTNIIPTKIIPGIIYLNDLGKNEKYFLYGLSSVKNGLYKKINILINITYIYIAPTCEINIYNSCYTKQT